MCNHVGMTITSWPMMLAVISLYTLYLHGAVAHEFRILIAKHFFNKHFAKSVSQIEIQIGRGVLGVCMSERTYNYVPNIIWQVVDHRFILEVRAETNISIVGAFVQAILITPSLIEICTSFWNSNIILRNWFNKDRHLEIICTFKNIKIKKKK